MVKKVECETAEGRESAVEDAGVMLSVCEAEFSMQRIAVSKKKRLSKKVLLVEARLSELELHNRGVFEFPHIQSMPRAM